jgi:hypothetical protein
MILALLLLVLSSPQTTACDKTLSFCWFDDKVEASGNRWVPTDPSEKQLVYDVTLNCLKQIRTCIVASKYPSESRIAVHLWTVTSWDSVRVVAENSNVPDLCEHETIVVTRADRTTLLLSGPGREADKPVCTNFMGKPKTVVYKLVDDVAVRRIQ